MNKRAVIKSEPGFICSAAIPKDKDDVQQSKMKNLVEKLFDGSPDMLISALLKSKNLNGEKLSKLREIIDSLEGEK